MILISLDLKAGLCTLDALLLDPHTFIIVIFSYWIIDSKLIGFVVNITFPKIMGFRLGVCFLLIVCVCVCRQVSGDSRKAFLRPF